MRQVLANVPGVLVAVLLAVCCGCGNAVREEPGGKTTVENEKGKLTLQSRPGDDNSLSIETKTGEKFTVGSGANAEVRLPSWIPACPNSTVKGTSFEENAGRRQGMVIWTTTDAPQKVYQFYEKALRDAGLTVNTMTQDAGVSGGVLMARETPEKRSANITIGTEKGLTTVLVGYVDK